ncbi:LuxR C-terminal-related transcriptional regulator [Brevundimonas sp. FT23028]|uniref:LuxR C-terminal-related transcriptional regulator n=1 Tax=Brevundimonas sp. FT23028 TaxID=3393748 RepID=UPI003B58B1B3
MRWIVLIVDDHPLVGQAFELSIKAAYPHLDVGRVTSAAEADAYVRQHGDRVKLVMLDLMLPDAEGFSALLRLQKILPDGRIAIVSARTDNQTLTLAKALGAVAYLSKSEAVEVLVEAVGAILQGAILFPEQGDPDPQVLDAHRRISTLSAGQLRIMRALVDGKLNKQIAGDMNLTEGTVKQHVSAILKKLQVNNRSQAILIAAPVLRNDQASS